jgi:fructokinase
MSDHAGAIAVIGEALLDIVEAGDDDPRLARPGGSPYNVALGLARLECPARFVGRLSRDPLGMILRNHALRSAVDLSLCVDASEPTTVALVELDDTGAAQYRFGIDGTADFRWTPAELARVPVDVAAVHFGSLASWTAPGDAVIAARRSRASCRWSTSSRPARRTSPTCIRGSARRTSPAAGSTSVLGPSWSPRAGTVRSW